MEPEGWTPLHEAARQGRLPDVARLLREGADPNARESGDNTTPLHWAAGQGKLEIVRALLDAGADPQGEGDVHQLDIIGWAVVYHEDGDTSGLVSPTRRAVADLLVERGARHHIFSALALGEADRVRDLVAHDEQALKRRLSRFEQGLTPLHFVIQRKRYDLLELLIQLGSDLEATNQTGQTALAAAMLHGDLEAARRLMSAGAAFPEDAEGGGTGSAEPRSLAGSVSKIIPMIHAPDVSRAIDWYASIGFTEGARFPDDGELNWAMIYFGKAQVMLTRFGEPRPHDTSLWFYTDRIDELYRTLRARQLRAVRGRLAGEASPEPGVEFVQDLEDMFYEARQFCVRDLNGYELYFIQPTSQPSGKSPD